MSSKIQCWNYAFISDTFVMSYISINVYDRNGIKAEYTSTFSSSLRSLKT